MNKNNFFISWFIRDVPRPEGGGAIQLRLGSNPSKA